MRNAMLCLLLIALLAVVGCSKPAATPQAGPGSAATSQQPAGKGEVTVFAAIVSKPALEELAKQYEAKSGTKVTTSFGGSGAQLTQFAKDQYGDVFVPASADYMDKAEQQQAVDKSTRVTLASLSPVIAVAKGNPKRITGLKDLSRADVRVALADPKAAAAGKTSKAILEKAGIWDQVSAKVVSFGNNVEETRNTLLMGEADVAILWDVDVRGKSDKLEAITLPADVAKASSITAAVITYSKQAEQAKSFVDFLASEEGRKVFAEKGYTLKISAAR